jgi:Uma2 family endonuclease
MSTTRAAHRAYTFEEYLQLAESSNIKLEFIDGEIFAMAGGSLEHARRITNIAKLLGSQLEDERCAAFTAELRVRVLATGLAAYPDLAVICGQPELDPADSTQHTATNPRVLVEVLSPSTEQYDRTEKLAHYQQIPSLAEVVLVPHDARTVEVYRREPQGYWSHHVAVAGEAAPLVSIGCSLAVDRVHAGTPIAKI